MLRAATARSAVVLRSSGFIGFCSLPSEAGKEAPKEKPKFNYKTVDQFKSEGGRAGMRDHYSPGFSPANPTPRQRKMLVLLRMYKSEAEIPEFVSMQTMQHMRDRLRVVVAVIATVLFLAFYIMAHDSVHNRGAPVDRRKF